MSKKNNKPPILEDIFLKATVEEPYFSQAFSVLRPVEIPIEEMPFRTMAVDNNWRLLYNTEVLEEWGVDTGAAVLSHEIRHLLRDHHGRQQTREKELWNIASDCEINDDLRDLPLPEGIAEPGVFRLPDNLLAEEYYNSLEDQAEEQGQGTSCPGVLDGPDEGEDPDCPTPEEVELIKEAVAQEIKQQEPGNVPKGDVVWADVILKPTPPAPWRRVLTRAIKTTIDRIMRGTEDYSWTKLPRRSRPEILRPGMVGKTSKIGVIVDTSGSMGLGEGSKALGILKTIRRLATGYEVKVWSCDTEIHEVKANTFLGGGGTDMGKGIEVAIKDGCGLVVVVTDGYTPWPSDPPEVPVVVALLGETSVPPWVVQIIKIKD